MQEKLLKYLSSPVDKSELKLLTFKMHKKTYNTGIIEECYEGLLLGGDGYMFPIVNGVPRMQLDSFLEYESFLKANFPEFDKRKNELLNSYAEVIKDAVKKTKKTKKSFGQEWAIFKYDNDKTWGFTADSRKTRFLDELNVTPDELAGKKLVDIGCGNGVLTSALSDFGMETFGIDVSPSVESAYINNQKPNVHFIQGDLQNPPFKSSEFDIVYSTGVIHHTNNTELSFSCISPLVKPDGRLYIWLYKPEKDLRHRMIVKIRKVTNKLPIGLQYFLYLVFLVPWGLLKEMLRGKKLTWREQLINYFDVLSPEFRYEHTPKEVEIWYRKRNFDNIKVTIVEYLGFGIYGDKC
ncbi:MAG: class I SAM-dependent methyltransferase [Ignavibacteriae bacterium]|nr:MAG: class I SAM-dependent methyltransferase [Ignavibacteriota bacterium]